MALDVRTDPSTHGAPSAAPGAQRARYLPIAEHGLIGDLHTVALVGTDGTIDWYCCPRFDSPSVFAAILDADRGGLFRIGPDGDGWTSKQLYLPDTNVLITRFLMADGVGEVQDFMVPAHPGRLIRRVLAELSDRDQEILTRFYLQEQGQDQICDEMSLSETQFRLLKSRAKARFGELGRKKLAHRNLQAVFLRTSVGLSH